MNTIAACDDLHRLTPGERRTAGSAERIGRAGTFLSRESVGRRRAGRLVPTSLSATASALRLARIRTVRAGGVTGPDARVCALLLATGSGLRSEPPRVSVRAGRFPASSLTGGRANAVAVFSLTNIAAT